ncbi:nucleotidyltransferase domain-containing protein [Candidatus Parcubacteria bacterium]|nr:nucleotidyltransferase domain-containing protein [Candidatus Parcubacteria bacterium]
MIKLTKQQLNRLARKYNINTFYVFGSQATGKTTKLSDYDFAVLLSDKVPEKLYGDYQIKIISELLRLVKSDHIDLIILNNKKTPLLLKYNVIKEGKILFEKNKSKRVNIEVNILRRWLDWQYFEGLWGDIYVKCVAEGKF